MHPVPEPVRKVEPLQHPPPDTGNPNVVHESEAQRQHVRVRLPGLVEFNVGAEHCRFRLHDLSAGGLSFESTRAFRVGQAFKGNLVLNVDAIAIALSVSFQVRNYDPKSGRTGCCFQEMGSKEISTLRRIIGSFLAGEIVGVGDVLHTLGRDNFSKPRGGKLAPPPQETGQRVRSLVITACFLVAGVAAFVYTLRQANRILFMTTAVAAKVAGPSYNIAMPREGTLFSLIPADGVVKRGAPLATFEAPVFDLVRNEAMSVNITPQQLQQMMGMTVKGTLTSPCDCRVQQTFVSDSQYVARGQPLFELMPLDFKPYLVARFRFDQVDDLAVGTPVHFSVAGDHDEHEGSITQVRSAGQGDSVESDIIVVVTPDEALPMSLLSRPAQVSAGNGLFRLPKSLPFFGSHAASPNTPPKTPPKSPP